MQDPHCQYCCTQIRGRVCYNDQGRAMHFGCLHFRLPPPDGKKVRAALLADVGGARRMSALEMVWLHPAYRYRYEADVSGKGRVKLTLRRQLRELNLLTAHWYRQWQARALLQELYGNIFYKLDPEGRNGAVPEGSILTGEDLEDATSSAQRRE